MKPNINLLDLDDYVTKFPKKKQRNSSTINPKGNHSARTAILHAV
jgi:hypothetical protein